MGNNIDFSRYLSKEDCLTLDSALMSSKMMLAAERLNEHLIMTGKLSSALEEPEKDIFYPLMQHIQTFFNYYAVELNQCLQLKFEIFNLLNRIKRLNHQQNNLTQNILNLMSDNLINAYIISPPRQMLHDLMVYETYVYLGVIKDLEVHHKLRIDRVRDLNLYSVLMSDYKAPRIDPTLLERYFQENRTMLLAQLIKPEVQIKHIHYDFEFLKFFATVDKILKLSDRDSEQYLNQKIRSEVF